MRTRASSRDLTILRSLQQAVTISLVPKPAFEQDSYLANHAYPHWVVH